MLISTEEKHKKILAAGHVSVKQTKVKAGEKITKTFLFFYDDNGDLCLNHKGKIRVIDNPSTVITEIKNMRNFIVYFRNLSNEYLLFYDYEVVSPYSEKN